MTRPSQRIAEFIDALPLKRGMRVLEIGCGPGVAARLVAERVAPSGMVLAIDRSATAIAQARRASRRELDAGWLSLRRVAVEELALDPNEARFHLAFAMRVGVLDGRHPELELQALSRIKAALVRGGRLFIDGGAPLRRIDLARV